MLTINLSGKQYPFIRTAEGAMLMQRLKIDFVAIANHDREEVKRYAYCIAAGAAQAENVSFNFTIDEFIKACPYDWKQKVTELIERTEKTESTDENEGIKTIEAVEEKKAVETIEKVEKPPKGKAY